MFFCFNPPHCCSGYCCSLFYYLEITLEQRFPSCSSFPLCLPSLTTGKDYRDVRYCRNRFFSHLSEETQFSISLLLHPSYSFDRGLWRLLPHFSSHMFSFTHSPLSETKLPRNLGSITFTPFSKV